MIKYVFGELQNGFTHISRVELYMEPKSQCQ